VCMRMSALHLDASRSAALFGDRVVLVEGVNEGLLLRSLVHSWAWGNAERTEVIDSLSIVPLGCRVGE